jgi:alkylhydroperoxidase family enzyme
MARLPYLEKAEVTPDLRVLYEKMEEAFGTALNPAKLMAYFPAFLQAVWGLLAALEQAAEIDTQLRSLVRVRVATINGCPF